MINIGDRFGRLIVQSNTGTHTYPCGQKTKMWKCMCDCGKETVVLGRNLTSGNTTSCGCFLEQCRGTHHESGTLLYKTWLNIKQRCSNPNVKKYKRYLEKGISVCDDWKASYESFRDWAMANGYRKGLTIDRINNDGNYEPSNCRWITMAEQHKNKDQRTGNLKVIVDGEEVILSELSKKLGIPYQTLYYRHVHGKPLLTSNYGKYRHER